MTAHADDIPKHRYTAALAGEIERAWQERWDAEHVFWTPNRTGLLAEDPRHLAERPNRFVLDMFPYPSGVGLHVGHPLGFIATDVYARFSRMDGFSSSAAGDFHDQLKTLVDAGVNSIVFDLRGDAGGFVDAAEKIASEFVASGPIFWEAFADGTEIAHEAIPGGVATDPALQVVVLVDGGTASASEIVAAALQDSGRARLVGAQTFGKGTIQQWQTLTDDTGGFRLSVAKWLTPDKRWIHERGLPPDVLVTEPAGADPDVVLERALELLGAPAP